MAAARGSSKAARFATCIALVLSALSPGEATAHVPLLLWSSHSLSLAPPAAGHITSTQQLTSDLGAALGPGPHTLLLFLQDQLSTEDFTVFGGAFGNKQDSVFKNVEAALRSSASSVSFPALEWSGPSVAPSLFQQTLGGAAPLLVDADTLSHLSINASSSNLLLINLPYCSGSLKSCQQVLRDNDDVIGNVLSVMKQKELPYTAVYTGLRPSRVIPEDSGSGSAAGRTLLQAPPPPPPPSVRPPLMLNASGSPCIMLWAQNLSVSLSDGSWVDLGAETPTVGGACDLTQALLVLTYPSPPGFVLSFSLTQRFYPVSARNWSSLDLVQLRSGGQTASFLGGRSIYSPVEYSYSCASVSSFRDALLLPNNSNSNTSQWRLDFVSFQIQGFGLSNSSDFSYASDCAGFFTPGIWMGLVTGLLLLLIFTYGLHMILQLHTMDRFDDPKGPSISVPQAE